MTWYQTGVDDAQVSRHKKNWHKKTSSNHLLFLISCLSSIQFRRSLSVIATCNFCIITFMTIVIITAVTNSSWRLWLVTMVTKFPNHWWASSCPTTSATHCLEDEQEFFGSISSAVSLENNRNEVNTETDEGRHFLSTPAGFSSINQPEVTTAAGLFIKTT